jgi:transcriptional regulator with PAS, ATPase and Fis domain
MRQVVEYATRFARSSATVLLTGESGTGKELVARLIHESSPRCDKRYVRVNCAALPESLMESELFGHERGAFTGAMESRIGRFEWANEGTLLLDEISEIPISIQAKLLRVLEEEEFHRIGTNAVRNTDVRVLATTNRDLEVEIEKGNFRADLYHRLNVLDIKLPPLRERPEDIPVLVSRFIGYFRDEANVSVRGVSESAMRMLVDYSWPGNVRQLRNVIHRACVLTSSEIIQLQELPPLRSSSESMPDVLLNLTLAEIERLVILNSLNRFNGNKTAAAAHLGVTARTLSNKLKLYRQQECA